MYTCTSIANTRVKIQSLKHAHTLCKFRSLCNLINAGSLKSYYSVSGSSPPSSSSSSLSVAAATDLMPRCHHLVSNIGGASSSSHVTPTSSAVTPRLHLGRGSYPGDAAMAPYNAAYTPYHHNNFDPLTMGSVKSPCRHSPYTINYPAYLTGLPPSIHPHVSPYF